MCHSCSVIAVSIIDDHISANTPTALVVSTFTSAFGSASPIAIMILALRLCKPERLLRSASTSPNPLLRRIVEQKAKCF